MTFRILRRALMVCGFALTMFAAQNAQQAGAGWLFNRKPAPPPPAPPIAPVATINGPRTQRYVVVVPRQVKLPPSEMHPGVPRPDIVWSQENLAAPAYPWGWFGPRETPKAWAHTSYYQDSYDFKWIHGN
jgi:hypothetical protein